MCSVNTHKVLYKLGLSFSQKERCQLPIVSEETKGSTLSGATGVPACKSRRTTLALSSRRGSDKKMSHPSGKRV